MNAPMWSPFAVRGPHDQGHAMRRRRLDERRQAGIVFRESQLPGETQLVAGQRKLGEHDEPCALLGCRADEPPVLLDVGTDVTPPRNRLG